MKHFFGNISDLFIAAGGLCMVLSVVLYFLNEGFSIGIPGDKIKLPAIIGAALWFVLLFLALAYFLLDVLARLLF